MSYQPQKLMLYKGLPSSASLGNTGTTDSTPETFNLRDGVFGLYDEKPFEPQIAGLKEGAVWLDAVSMDGRELLAGGDANVIETVHLRAGATEDTLIGRAAAIKTLRRFALAAQEFWTHRHNVDPVYLCWWATGALHEQYALVSSIKIVSVVDGFNPNRVGLLTLQIEREPYWRPVGPGGNPKLFAFQQRGLIEMVDYDHDELDLMDFANANADLRHLAEATLYAHDQSTSLSHTDRVNFIDIPASACAGDAPIPVMVTYSPNGGSPNVTELHIAQTSARDFFPTVYENNGASTGHRRRLGCSLAAADAFIFSTDVDLSVTALAEGNIGLYSGYSAVTPHLLNFSYTANPVEGMACYWDRAIAQFPGRYAVFLRVHVTSGTATDIGFRVGVNIGTSGTPDSEWAYLTASGYSVLYLGEVNGDQIGRRAASADGDGIDDDGNFSLYLHTKKAPVGGANVYVIDVVLLPIDEGYTRLVTDTAVNGAFSFSSLLLDGTGYHTGGPLEQIGARRDGTSVPGSVEQSGTPILLRPGVQNRLYFIPKTSESFPAQTYQVRVNLLPRWAGMRDE